jgi:4'-phosphopantetheinyl transferase EntD
VETRRSAARRRHTLVARETGKLVALLELDSTHVIVQMLREMLPEGVVAGGSFAAALPPARSLPRDARRSEHERVRQLAMEQCIADVVSAAGLPYGTTIPQSSAGRRWPSVYVGSATDKATLVAAALAPKTVVTALGIDIEHNTPGGMSLDASLIGPESAPPQLDPSLALLVAFSAKEAVFKAQFAETRAQLSYHDIEIRWCDRGGTALHGLAIYAGAEGAVTVRCSTAAPWVAAVALVHASTV